MLLSWFLDLWPHIVDPSSMAANRCRFWLYCLLLSCQVNALLQCHHLTIEISCVHVMQQAMAVLAFRADTKCSPYKDLFEEQQWQSLVELFYQELYRLNNLTPQSVLAVHLQVRLWHVRYTKHCAYSNSVLHIKHSFCFHWVPCFWFRLEFLL